MLNYQSPNTSSELNGQFANHLLLNLNRHMNLFGYKLIELPIIESTDLFLVKAGDQIINSLFTFERQGRQLALRPEFTALASNYYAQGKQESIVRWQFAGSIFEDKSHVSSDNFEQLSIGAELIGLKGSSADAEIIAMAATGLQKINIPDVHITIGNIGLIRAILTQFDLDYRTKRFLLHYIPALNDPLKGKGWVIDQFDKEMSISGAHSSAGVPSQTSVVESQSSATPNSERTMGGRTQEEIALRLKLKRQRVADRDKVINAINFLWQWCELTGEPESIFSHLNMLVDNNSIAGQLLREWQSAVELLEVYGFPSSNVTIKPDLNRSWEYYTGIIFELYSSNLHVGGGGRYDDLARLMGANSDTPSVGFAYYGNQLREILEPMSDSVDPIATIECEASCIANAIEWATRIRTEGISVSILLYALGADNRANTIRVDSSKTASFRGKSFVLDQTDLLIAELKL